ncbi:hypothetical protein CH063_00899, partial [Colletotrichum higginsianum]
MGVRESVEQLSDDVSQKRFELCASSCPSHMWSWAKSHPGYSASRRQRTLSACSRSRPRAWRSLPDGIRTGPYLPVRFTWGKVSTDRLASDNPSLALIGYLSNAKGKQRERERWGCTHLLHPTGSPARHVSFGHLQS